MTNQEFEKELAELLADNTSGKKRREKKGETASKKATSGKWMQGRQFWRKWSRKRKIITGAVALAAALVLVPRMLRGSQEEELVKVANLEKGNIEEVLSISGPVSGTDSAEVVSGLHAEIREILVKEGDKVEKGQVLARLDTTNVQREVDIARNAYDLAVANSEQAQIQAKNGYAKAVQNEQAARLDYERKSVLYQSGDIAQMELEAARDALSDAVRQIAEFTLEGGKPVADKSYALQIKNAEFELEQKKKALEETEVTSPIAGTVVRVNSRVGRFADRVDDDKPLFVIDNLESLEMKIQVSEYSIGKVKVGQTAQIHADILEGDTEEGVITSISPTGEEKGAGSTERVIPTTIQIQNPDTGLIAGITARAKIVLNHAEDTWVVPAGAILQKEDGTYLASVENNQVKLVPVELGVESDMSVEVTGQTLGEGFSYIVSPRVDLKDGDFVKAVPSGEAAVQ